MSVQRILKLEETLQILNSSDSYEIVVEIAMLPPNASEVSGKDEGDENEHMGGVDHQDYLVGLYSTKIGENKVVMVRMLLDHHP
ncbi:hypothetical protein TNCV_3004481 [Trichonephila clavipes]|nr:hypothetical protein TNCV_3004481 [Trichonephila clavipes]